MQMYLYVDYFYSINKTKVKYFENGTSLTSGPTILTAFSIADEDKVPFILTIRDFFEPRKITQPAYAFNKWRDTFYKINDWEEMLEFHHENSNPLIKKTALSLIRKCNYDNNQIKGRNILIKKFYFLNKLNFC